MRGKRRAANRLHVLADFYQYHAWRPRGSSNRVEQALLRYDQARGGLHRHYDDEYGEQLDCEPMMTDPMPRPAAVIREANALGGD